MKKNTLFALLFAIVSLSNSKAQTTLSLLDSYYIGNIVSEPSGLAFDKVNNQLFAVSDADNIYRLSTTGSLLESYNFSGNLEGVSIYNAPNTLLVAVENTFQLIEFNYVTGATTPHTMDYNNMGNINGIEGVTYNPGTGDIYFLNEKSPGALIVANSDFNVTNEYILNFAGDYSASYFVEETGVLWLGSDESSSVYKCNLEGSVIESISISANGLPLLKFEGLAIDHENQLLYALTDGGQELLVYEITDPTLNIPNESAQNNAIILYPNPVNNSQELTIKLTNNKQDLYTVSIYTPLGQLKSEYTANSETIKLNIKDLPAGIYYASIKLNDITVVKKFMKKNL